MQLCGTEEQCSSQAPAVLVNVLKEEPRTAHGGGISARILRTCG